MFEETPPREVEDLIEMAQSSVAEVVGVTPDLTPETLPLVDQYLRQLGPETQEHVLELVLAAVGCHFGEVVRRKLQEHPAAVELARSCGASSTAAGCSWRTARRPGASS